MRKVMGVMVLLSLAACDNTSTIDKTMDSTLTVADSQKYITKDSVAHKSDSNQRIIDSSFQVLKDSMKKAK